MTVNSLFSFLGALVYGVLAVIALLRDRKSFVHRTFAIGMAALALEAILTGFSLQAISSIEVIRWQRLRLMATSVLPGIWLLFSLTFARADYKNIVLKFRWLLIAAFTIPILPVAIFNKFLFVVEDSLYNVPSGWFLHLGWFGYSFHLIFLISAMLILMNLEKIFRASTGSVRWQIKFIVLGVGGIFAFRVYSGSQALLFSFASSTSEIFNIGASIICGVLITIGFVRMRILNIDIYFSQTLLYNSLIVLIIGIYFLIVGGLAEAIRYFNTRLGLPIEALLVFVSLLGLTIALLSDQVRQRIRQLVYLHFKRPHHDYRKEWMEFTQRTSSLLDIKQLCSAVMKMVSNTFGTPAVTIWLADLTEEKFVPAASTAFSESQGQGLEVVIENLKDIVRFVKNKRMPMDLSRSKGDLSLSRNFLREAQIRYCVPLFAGNDFLGIMTLSDRLTKEEFSMEDLDLLKTIAYQAATSILNVRMSERIKQAKEMEIVQTMSSFFVHDLKNLASALSLTVRNLPVHFDNPEFRNDALTMMKQSINKINSMCNHLSVLGKGIELSKVETDLNGFIKNSLTCLNGSVKVPLIQDLRPVAKLMIDPEQLQKVLTNLVLNANEAVGHDGEIRVSTEQRDGWVTLAVSDNGCGMSKDFMEQSLFRPFKTTKKQGMGIGLFQSKMIVEAHQGRIEAESEPSRGSVFRVFLPLAGK